MNQINLQQCDFPAGEYIRKSYNDLADANTMIDFPGLESDVAELERQLARQVARLSRDPSTPFVNKEGPVVRIGIDSEYFRSEESAGKTPPENTILSVQLHLKGDSGDLSRIYYPKSPRREDRFRLSQLTLRMVMDALDMGIISDFPSMVIVAGFFLRLDLGAFSDLPDFKNELDSAGGKVATIGKAVEFRYDAQGRDIPRNGKTTQVVQDGASAFVLTTSFIDIARHTSEGTTLEAIGETIGLSKINLPEGYTKDRMDLFLRDDKAAFEQYAMRDAEIVVGFLERLENFAREKLGSKDLAATAGGAAIQMLKRVLDEGGCDFNAAWGFETIQTESWNDHRGKVHTQRKIVANSYQQLIEPLVVNSYHGGRNECFMFGPTSIGDWFDFDLAGAYTTGLVDLRHINYTGLRHTNHPQDFVGHVLGFAWVDFSFPEDTRFPCLPVEVGTKGLYFPLAGRSFCTAPEIDVALRLGCHIKILQGVIIPWKEGDRRIFEPFVTRVRELRAEFKRQRVKPDDATMDEEYAKLIGNSAYGKLAQGLKEKTVFDTRGMRSVKLPPSAITNAIMASHTTGLVRAVMAELLIGVPTDCTVISVTTDGFLTNAPLDRINVDGPMARRFQALCERVAPDTAMLECKHRVHQLIAMKTRGQVTVIQALDEKGEPTKPVLAKAGVSPPIAKAEHNEFMLNLFLTRVPGQMTTSRPFTSLRKQWTDDVDVVRMERPSLLNLEFDFKRMPVNPRMVDVAGQQHIAFDTQPWPCSKVGERSRATFDGWRRHRSMKTMEDWDAWQAHYQFSSARSRRSRATPGDAKHGINMTKDGPVGLMKRLFLRAFVRSTYGVTCDSGKLTHRDMADWLTSLGFPTKKSAVSNSIREELVEHVVPLTDEVLAFIGAVKVRFPEMEADRFLVPATQVDA